MNRYNTYAHYTADTNELFYIGKGKNNRHESKKSRTKFWHHKVNKHGFYSVVLAVWKSEKEAFEHEKLLISIFREKGLNLVNLTDGGEGRTMKRTGKQLDALRQYRLGKDPWNKGLTKETDKRVLKYSQSLAAHVRTKEHGEAISKAKKGKFLMTEKWKQARSEKIECPHCEILVDKANAKRWHFDNCRKKENK